MTSLKDCSSSEKLSFQATTRQLFVGMVGLTVLSQDSVTIADTSALQSVVRGLLDADPVVISTFTYRRDGCVHDLVVWKGVAQETADSELTTSFSEIARHIASSLLDGAVSEETLNSTSTSAEETTRATQ